MANEMPEGEYITATVMIQHADGTNITADEVDELIDGCVQWLEEHGFECSIVLEIHDRPRPRETKYRRAAQLPPDGRPGESR